MDNFCRELPTFWVRVEGPGQIVQVFILSGSNVLRPVTRSIVEEWISRNKLHDMIQAESWDAPELLEIEVSEARFTQDLIGILLEGTVFFGDGNLAHGSSHEIVLQGGVQKLVFSVLRSSTIRSWQISQKSSYRILSSS